MHSPSKEKSHPAFLPLSPLIHQQTLRDPKAHSIDMSVNPKAGWFEGKLLMRRSSLEFLSLTWGKERKLKCVCIVFHLHTVLRYLSHPQADKWRKALNYLKKQINHYSNIWGKYKTMLHFSGCGWNYVQLLVQIQIRDLNHSFLFKSTFLYTKKQLNVIPLPILSHQQLVGKW